MNIQDEVQKIHHQYGTSEKANYEIQKLFDAELKKMYSEEEVELLVNKAMCYVRNNNPKITLIELKQWFEQFKKK